MALTSFVEGPLLWTVALIFIFGVIVRFVLSIYAAVKGSRDNSSKGPSALASTLRSFFPFYKVVSRKPVYASLRYIFHLCLIIVPIWFSGHIVLWEESRLGWGWTPLPDAWADGMTIAFLALAACFTVRRIFLGHERRSTGVMDWIILIITVLPFLSGFVLAHVDFEPDTFPARHLGTIHILTGEAMLLMVVFLFCRTWIDKQKCVGCAACDMNCSPGALQSRDEKEERIFSYLPYRCIVCGECVKTCPEEAVELRHRMVFKTFFQALSRQDIQSVDLNTCESCGTPFAPLLQVEKVADQIHDTHVFLCRQCKEEKYVSNFYRQIASGQ